MGKSKISIIDMKPIEKRALVTFLYYDVKNANGRIYTTKTAADIYDQAQKLIINNGCLLGELNYPNRIEVSIKDVSHKIDDIQIDPNKKTISGAVEILDTPKGNEVMNIIDNDIKNFDKYFVVRPRGTGSVNEKGEVENYTIFSFDIIPRDQDAYDPKNIEKNNQD